MRKKLWLLAPIDETDGHEKYIIVNTKPSRKYVDEVDVRQRNFLTKTEETVLLNISSVEKIHAQVNSRADPAKLKQVLREAMQYYTNWLKYSPIIAEKLEKVYKTHEAAAMMDNLSISCAEAGTVANNMDNSSDFAEDDEHNNGDTGSEIAGRMDNVQFIVYTANNVKLRLEIVNSPAFYDNYMYYLTKKIMARA